MARASDFTRQVMTKKDLYNVAIRNQFYMPKMKSSVCTEAYIAGVMRGEYWVPKLSELRLLACPFPPSKDALLAKFASATQEHGFLHVYVDREHRPDSKWLVDVLALLRPKDEIFRKGYEPPPRRATINDLGGVNIPAHLLEGIPETKSKAKRCRLKLKAQAVTIGGLKRLQLARKCIDVSILEKQLRLDDFKIKNVPRIQKPIVAREELKGPQIPVVSSPGSASKGGIIVGVGGTPLVIASMIPPHDRVDGRGRDSEGMNSIASNRSSSASQPQNQSQMQSVTK